MEASRAEVGEGLGLSGHPSNLPRPLVLFLAWSEHEYVKDRFSRFFDEHQGTFFGASSPDDDSDSDDRENSLAQHEVFRAYEHFFEAQTKAFLIEAKIDEEDFAEACEAVQRRARELRQADAKEGRRHSGEERKRTHESECKEGAEHTPRNLDEPVQSGDFLIHLALSSLNFNSFRRIMVRYRREALVATLDLQNMGVF